jgi:cytochrome bd ubiquinol oxidase subunit I
LIRRIYVNAATALLLLALAFGATAAGEFVREGARKPYTVRGILYSTSIKPAEVAELRKTGATAADPYPLRDAARYPTEQLRRGAKVFRVLCDACHTMSGANGVEHLTATWTDDQLRLNIAKLQKTKGFMPPFAGNAEDVEALVQLIKWERDDAPRTPKAALEASGAGDATLAQIARWLDEAGTQ